VDNGGSIPTTAQFLLWSFLGMIETDLTCCEPGNILRCATHIRSISSAESGCRLTCMFMAVPPL